MVSFLVFINHIPQHSTDIAGTVIGGKQMLFLEVLVYSLGLPHTVIQVVYCISMSH